MGYRQTAPPPPCALPPARLAARQCLPADPRHAEGRQWPACCIRPKTQSGEQGGLARWGAAAAAGPASFPHFSSAITDLSLAHQFAALASPPCTPARGVSTAIWTATAAEHPSMMARTWLAAGLLLSLLAGQGAVQAARQLEAATSHRPVALGGACWRVMAAAAAEAGCARALCRAAGNRGASHALLAPTPLHPTPLQAAAPCLLTMWPPSKS